AMSAFPVCSGVARTVDTSLATWTNDLSTFVSGKTNFCDCGFGGQVPACNGFICAGGDGDGGGGMCQQKACTGGGYTFDANDGWRIKNSMGGTPWRAFAYIEPCGPNNSNSCVNEMAFSFKFQNSATWGGWINLLFFGDSNKVLGLWPNKGMQLVGFPPGDMPNTWAGNLTMVDGEWYDVKVTLGINSSTYMTAQIAHGDTFVKWTSPEPRTALNRAYIGMYTFSPAGPAVTLSLKNFCMGKDNTCNWKCGSGGPTPSSAPTKKPTSAPTQQPTEQPTSAPTQRPTSAPSSSPSQQPTSSPSEEPAPSPSDSPDTPPPDTPSPSDSPVTPPPDTPSPSDSPDTPPPVTPSPSDSPVTPPPDTPSPSDSPVTPPPDTPSPSDSPDTPPPVTPSPSDSPDTPPPVTPSPSSSGHVPPYGQCGGNNYQGSTQCSTGYHCNEYNEWYSQCIPSPALADRQGVAAYGRCGGNGYSGPTECTSGYNCKQYTEWYSQCVPDDY
ncbi:unnamed protein product, partial [Aphanomyces euteiches]